MTFQVTIDGLFRDNEPATDLVAHHVLDDAVGAALGDAKAIGYLVDGEEAGHPNGPRHVVHVMTSGSGFSSILNHSP
jgi:hypothetical protein